MTAIKLDENLGSRLLDSARTAGFDAESVSTQKLNGVPDDSLFEHCKGERRVLITLDLDFSNPLRFSTEGSAGTIVLRPRRPASSEIASLFDEALVRLRAETVADRDSAVYRAAPHQPFAPSRRDPVEVTRSVGGHTRILPAKGPGSWFAVP